MTRPFGFSTIKKCLPLSKTSSVSIWREQWHFLKTIPCFEYTCSFFQTSAWSHKHMHNLSKPHPRHGDFIVLGHIFELMHMDKNACDFSFLTWCLFWILVPNSCKTELWSFFNRICLMLFVSGHDKNIDWHRTGSSGIKWRTCLRSLWRMSPDSWWCRFSTQPPCVRLAARPPFSHFIRTVRRKRQSILRW